MARAQSLRWELTVDGKTVYPAKLQKPSKIEETIDAVDGKVKYQVPTMIEKIEKADVTVNVTSDLADFKFMQSLVDGKSIKDVFAIGRNRNDDIILKYLWEECEFIEGALNESDASSPALETKVFSILPKNVTRID